MAQDFPVCSLWKHQFEYGIYKIPKSLKLFSKGPITYKKESSLCTERLDKRFWRLESGGLARRRKLHQHNYFLLLLASWLQYQVQVDDLMRKRKNKKTMIPLGFVFKIWVLLRLFVLGSFCLAFLEVFSRH